MGRVQGVGFRYSARHAALQFGIMGFVRNLPDGNVYVEAEGTDLQLQDFLDWCKKGAPRSTVSHISTIEGISQGFNKFEIR